MLGTLFLPRALLVRVVCSLLGNSDSKKKMQKKNNIYILVLSLQDRLQFRWDNKYMIVVVDIDIVVVVVVFLDLLSRAHPSLLRRCMDRWGPMSR